MKKTVLIKELREKDISALGSEIIELNQKMVKLRLDAAMKKLKNVKQIQDMRKRIARIWTVLNEKALEKIKSEVIK